MSDQTKITFEQAAIFWIEKEYALHDKDILMEALQYGNIDTFKNNFPLFKQKVAEYIEMRNSEFQKLIIKLDKFYDGIPIMKESKLRPEDIISCGFILVWNDVQSDTFKQIGNLANRLILTCFHEQNNENRSHIKINYTTGWQLFDGFIQNKFELNLLLKFLAK